MAIGAAAVLDIVLKKKKIMSVANTHDRFDQSQTWTWY